MDNITTYKPTEEELLLNKMLGTNPVEPNTGLTFQDSPIYISATDSPDLTMTPEHQETYKGMKNLESATQNFGEAFGNFLMQGVLGEVVGGGLEGVGYAFDMVDNVKNVEGANQEFGNWLSDIGKGLRETMQEEFPIYESDPGGFRPDNWSWWLKNGTSVFSTLSLMIPAIGIVKGISALGKVAKAISIVEKFGVGAAWAAEGIGTAVVSRHMENMMEAAGVYDEMIKTGIESGLGLEQAREQASQAAAKTYNLNWAMLAQDIPQYMLLLKAPKVHAESLTAKMNTAFQQSLGKEASTLNNLALTSKKWGQKFMDMGSEGLEEGYQYIVSENSKDELLHPEENFTSRLGRYMKDSEFWTNMSMGALGAGAMHGISHLSNGFSKSVIEKNNKRLDEIVTRGSRFKEYWEGVVAADALGDPTLSKKVRGEMLKNMVVESAKVGNLQNMIDFLNQAKQLPKEKLAELGLDENFIKAIPEWVGVAERIGKNWTKNTQKYGNDIGEKLTVAQWYHEDAIQSKKEATDAKAKAKEELKAHDIDYEEIDATQFYQDKEGNLPYKTIDNKLNVLLSAQSYLNTFERQKKIYETHLKNPKNEADKERLTKKIALAESRIAKFKGIVNELSKDKDISKKIKQKGDLLSLIDNYHKAVNSFNLAKDEADEMSDYISALVNPKAREELQKKSEESKKQAEESKAAVNKFTEAAKKYHSTPKNSPEYLNELSDYIDALIEGIESNQDNREWSEQANGILKDKTEEYRLLTEKKYKKRIRAEKQREYMKQHKHLIDETAADMDIDEAFDMAPTLPVVYNKERGTLYKDNRDLVFKNTKGKKYIIPATETGENTFGSRDLYLQKLGSKNLDVAIEGDTFVISILGEPFTFETNIPLQAIEFEGSNIKSISLVNANGETIRITHKKLVTEIADYIFIHALLLEEFAIGAPIEIDGKGYLIDMSMPDLQNSKVYVIDKYGNKRQILAKLETIWNKDGSLNKKGQVIFKAIEEFNKQLQEKINEKISLAESRKRRKAKTTTPADDTRTESTVPTEETPGEKEPTVTSSAEDLEDRYKDKETKDETGDEDPGVKVEDDKEPDPNNPVEETDDKAAERIAKKMAAEGKQNGVTESVAIAMYGSIEEAQALGLKVIPDNEDPDNVNPTGAQDLTELDDSNEPISDTDYNTFVDTGNVSAEILNSIADKIKNSSGLSDREKAIHTNKTKEIEDILSKEVKKEQPQAKLDSLGSDVFQAVAFEQNYDDNLDFGTAGDPNIKEGTEGTLELVKDSTFPDNPEEAAIVLKVNGKVIGAMRNSDVSPAYKKARKQIYDALKRGEQVNVVLQNVEYSPNVATVKTTSASSIRKSRDIDTGVIIFNPGSTLKNQWIKKTGGTFEKSTDAPIFISVVMGLGATKKLSQTGLPPSVAEQTLFTNTYKDDPFAAQGQEGQAYVGVMNPSGVVIFMKASTSKLTRTAVNAAFESLKSGDFDRTREITHIDHDLKDTNKGVTSFIRVNDKNQFFIIYSETLKDYVKIDLKDWNEGKTTVKKVEVQFDEKGNPSKTVYKEEAELNIDSEVRNLLSRKRFQVDERKINQTTPYTSAVSGKEYANYNEYLSSENEINPEDRVDNRPSIISVDFEQKDYNWFTNVGIDFKIKTEEGQAPKVDTPVVDIKQTPAKKADKGDLDEFDGFPFSLTEEESNDTIDIEQVKKDLAKYNLPVQFFDTLQKVGKYNAMGYFKDSVIYLYTHAEKGTQYHEAFHGVFRTYLSKKEQYAIYKEARERYEIDKDRIKLLKELYPDMSNADIENLYFEEKLADEFVEYLKNKNDNTLTGKFKKFVHMIMDFINTYLTHKVTIDNLFRDMESKSPKIVQRKTKNYKTGIAYALKQDPVTSKPYEASIQNDIVSAINTHFLKEFYILKDKLDSENKSYKSIDPEKLYDNIRRFMLSLAFYHKDTDDHVSPNIAVELARKLKNKEAFTDEEKASYSIDKANALRFFDIYFNWHTKYEEGTKNPVHGWGYLATRQLRTWGLKTDMNLSEVVEDEKIYQKSHLEYSRKDTTSGKIKHFFSTVPSPKDNILGLSTFVPYDEVWQEVAILLMNSYSTEDMFMKMESERKFSPTIEHIMSSLERWMGLDKSYTPTSEDKSMITDFGKNLSLTYNNFIAIIEEIEKEEIGFKPNGEIDYEYTSKSRIIDSNTNKLESTITSRWKDNAFNQQDGLYIKNNSETGFVTNTFKVTELEDLFRKYLVGKYDSSDENIEGLKKFLNLLGIDISFDNLKSVFDKGTVIGKTRYKGGTLFNLIIKDFKLLNLVDGLKKEEIVHNTEGATFKNLAGIFKVFEKQKNLGFISGANKSYYPLNMHTALSREMNALKNYKARWRANKSKISKAEIFWNEWIEEFMDDPYYSPHGKALKGYEDLFLREILRDRELGGFDSKFPQIFEYVDLDVLKHKHEIVAKNTVDMLTPVTTKLARYNYFLNNGNKEAMRVAIPTLADRDRMIVVTIPRISLNSELHRYDRDIRLLLKGTIVQEVARMQRAWIDLTTLPATELIQYFHYKPNKGQYKNIEAVTLKKAVEEYNAGKHKVENEVIIKTLIGNGLTFKNNPDLRPLAAGQRIINWTRQSALKKELNVSEIEKDIDSLTNYLLKDIDKQAEKEFTKFKDLNIMQKDKAGRYTQNTFSMSDIEGLYETKGKNFEDAFKDMVKDYVVANILATNSIRKFTGGDIAFYKDYEQFSKRQGGIATPGYEQVENFTWKGVEFNEGSKESFTMATINDIFTDGTNLVEELKKAGVSPNIANLYKSVNGTDGGGIVKLSKYRDIAKGINEWSPKHEEAYRNYLEGKGFRYLDKRSNKFKSPHISPLKTYSYGFIYKNGRKVRIMIKHAVYPLLEEYAKKIPVLQSIHDRLNNLGKYTDRKVYPELDTVNMDSAVKIGLNGNLTLKYDERGHATNLEKLVATTVPTKYERLPQIIPEKDESPIWGSQLRKLIIANLSKNFKDSKIKYNLNGKELTAKELFNLYQDTGTQLIENSLNDLYEELGYKDNMSVEEQLEFMIKTAKILGNSVEERDLADNFLKVLNRVAETNKDGKVTGYSFDIPLSFPTLQKTFEQIIFSLFKNKVFRPRMNGKALVQIAELGGYEVFEDGKYSIERLKFTRPKDNKIAEAEIAIPYELADSLGLLDKEGNYNMKSIDPEALKMVGYRIPTSGKNSMLALKVKYILPPGMGKAVVVPLEITKQQGSDYDIDKLFIMMPNVTHSLIEYFTKELNTKYPDTPNKFSVTKDSQLLNKLFENPSFVDHMDLNFDEKLKLQNAVIEAKRSTQAEIEGNKLEPKIKKISYNENSLSTQSTAQLENLIMDITHSILTNPVHLEEIISPVDSPTLPNMALFAESYGEKLNPFDVNTEEILEIRNKVGSTGIGIYATHTTGASISQFCSLLEIVSKYVVKFSGKSYKDLTVIEDETGTLISYQFAKRLQIAVDNAKDPIAEFINDSAVTSSVLGLLTRSGVGDPRVGVRLTQLLLEKGEIKTAEESGMEGKAEEIASLFVMQPIIRRLVQQYVNTGSTPKDLRSLILEIGKEIDPAFELRDETINIDSLGLIDSLNDIKAKNQTDVLNNFYYYHQVGRMMEKTNKAFNVDRISDMSSLAAIEEYEDIREEVLSPSRNKYIKGAENILEGNDYKLVKTFYDMLNETKRFATQFFPFSPVDKDGTPIGLASLKEELRSALGKENLTQEVLEDFHQDAFLFLFSSLNSPIKELFSEDWEKDLLTGKNNISVQKDELDILRKDSTDEEMQKLATNKFYNFLGQHPDNIKMRNITQTEGKKKVKLSTERFKHKLLGFEYAYHMSGYERTELSDGLLNMYTSPNERIKTFTRNLILSAILSQGFTKHAKGFMDLIPNEILKDPNFGFNKVSLVDFYKKHETDFQNADSFAGFVDAFIENNFTVPGMLSTVKEKKDRRANNNVIDVGKYEGAYNSNTEEWAKYIVMFDHAYKDKVLFQFVTETSDGAKYTRIETRAVPNKIKYYNFIKSANTDYSVSKDISSLADYAAANSSDIPKTHNVVNTKESKPKPTSEKIYRGDIWKFPGIVVIPTNLGGVHGAGLAEQASKKGLIKKEDGNFKVTDKVIQFPVKKVWSDNMDINNNMDLLKDSLRKLMAYAKAHPDKQFLLPLVGLGHGEGKVEDIVPLLKMTIEYTNNIKLVLPTPDIQLGRKGTVRKDTTLEKLPQIEKLLLPAKEISKTSTQATREKATTPSIIKPDLYKDWKEAGGTSSREMFEQFFPTDEAKQEAINKLSPCRGGKTTTTTKTTKTSSTPKSKSDNIPHAEDGAQIVSGFAKKGKWTITEDLKGLPKHEKGGVDITVDKGNVHFSSGYNKIHAKHGLVIAASGLVVSPDDPPYKQVREEQMKTISYKRNLAKEMFGDNLTKDNLSLVQEELKAREKTMSTVKTKVTKKNVDSNYNSGTNRITLRNNEKDDISVISHEDSHREYLSNDKDKPTEFEKQYYNILKTKKNFTDLPDLQREKQYPVLPPKEELLKIYNKSREEFRSKFPKVTSNYSNGVTNYYDKGKLIYVQKEKDKDFSLEEHVKNNYPELYKESLSSINDKGEVVEGFTDKTYKYWQDTYNELGRKAIQDEYFNVQQYNIDENNKVISNDRFRSFKFELPLKYEKVIEEIETSELHNNIRESSNKLISFDHDSDYYFKPTEVMSRVQAIRQDLIDQKIIKYGDKFDISKLKNKLKGRAVDQYKSLIKETGLTDEEINHLNKYIATNSSSKTNDIV